MYLLPTQKEMDALWRQINPTARIMDYLYSRPPAAGSMAEFFMESEDIELAMEDDCTEFDYIDNNDDMLCMNEFTFDYFIDDAKGCGREDVIYDIKKKPIRTLWKIFTNKYY